MYRKKSVLATLVFIISLCINAEAADDLRPLKILHCSDLHGSKSHLQRIVGYAKEHALDDVVHTGDGVMCYFDDENIFETVPGAGKVLIVIGNHDCWKGHLTWPETHYPYDATKADAYERFFIGEDPAAPAIERWNVTRPEGVEDAQSPDYKACYYYKDYDFSGARLVVLDCIHYDEAQDEWLEAGLDGALNKGYAVIIATHYPAQQGLRPVKAEFTPSGEDYPDDLNPVDRQMDCTPIAAFDRVDSFIDRGGKFVCWLSGHEHNDYYGFVKGHERQIQILVDKSGEMDKYMYDKDRTGENTDAFNILTYYPESGEYALERIGCAEGLRGERVFRYKITNNEKEF